MPRVEQGPHVKSRWCGAVAAGLLWFVAPAGDTTPSVEQEVRDNISGQPVGRHRLADQGLPESFLGRIADRIIRSSYRERYQFVYDPGGGQSESPTAAPSRPSREAQTFSRIVRSPAHPTVVEEYRKKLVPGRPVVRGFRVPLIERATELWPCRAPGPTAPAELQRATDLVEERLARLGLLETLALVARELGTERMSHADTAELELLQAAGLPIDWLEHFEPRDGATPSTSPPATPWPAAAGLVRDVARWVAKHEGQSPAGIRAAFRFHFHKTHPTFSVATESGEHDPRLVRLQLTRGDYWGGRGDGGSVDIMRQLATVLPGSEFAISIEERFVPALQATAADWGLGAAGRFQLLVETEPISQWAQDNGKAGTVLSESGSRPATLIPRYASRREDGSEFVPAESLLQETLTRAGHAVIASPLLFQGGDVLAVREPLTGRRILLVGEAEVHRNTALGLDRDEVLQAFREEFSVERCEVLPSISFHVDFDVTFRAQRNGIVAFVNDPERAARILVRRGLDALVAQQTLDETAASRARRLLDQGSDREFVTLVAGPLYAASGAKGGLPLSLARGFSVGAPDSAVGNFERFLFALDLLASPTLTPEELNGPSHRSAYFRSLHRSAELRRELARQLEGLGWRVVGVPSFSEGTASMNYLNGIHARRRFLMPAYGGFFAPLDAAARQAFEGALGPDVEVVSVYCAETQRRMGGLHCSTGVYPSNASR